MRKHWTEKLVNMHACKEAVKWSKQYATLQEAWDVCDQPTWDVCDQPTWMIWLLNRTQPASTETHHAYVRIACAEARLALTYNKDHRVLTYIETVEGWERGERTQDEVNVAQAAIGNVAWNEAWVIWAVWNAGWAAESAAGYAAKDAIRKQCCDIIRKEFPEQKAFYEYIYR